MLIVGGLGNEHHKHMAEAISKRDKDYLKRLILEESRHGVDYISIGSLRGSLGNLEELQWFINIVQEEVALPFYITHVEADLLEHILSLCKHGRPIVGYVVAEPESTMKFVPIIQKHRTRVACLLTKNNQVPGNAEQRVDAARFVLGQLNKAGVPQTDIYLDPFIKPICYNSQAGLEVLEAIQAIKKEFPEVNFICDVSNISFGLPDSDSIDSIFMAQLMAVGINSFILNPVKRDVRRALYISKMLMGQDAFCREYLTAHRQEII